LERKTTASMCVGTNSTASKYNDGLGLDDPG
jgi:hypothetical protein